MPTAAEALARLNQSQNEPLRWLLGGLLVIRAGRTDWHECRILQQLASSSAAAEKTWNGLIDRFRTALACPAEAIERTKEILNPEAADFDGKLDDFVAEMISVVFLSDGGYSDFHFCPPGAVTLPDLRALKAGKDAFVEVKNLREPPSLTVVAFSRWHANQARSPEQFAFNVLIEYEGIEPELNREQRETLERVIDELPFQRRPIKFNQDLPGELGMALTLTDGNGVMMTHGPGGALDPVRIRTEQSVIYKLLAPAAKALSQLYSPAVAAEANRVMVLRWKVPDDVWLVEEEVRKQVGAAIQEFLGGFFPDLEVHLLSNLQQL